MRKYVINLLSLPKRLMSSRRGAVALMFALLLVPMLAAVGLAVDASSIYVLRNRLTRSVDAAALAAGRATDADDPAAIARSYLNANLGQLNMSYDLVDFKFQMAPDEKSVTVTATARMPTTFVRIFNRPTMDVVASARVERAVTGLELAIILDNTGSMARDGKFPAMKRAADRLLEVLFEGEEEVDGMWLSLVPYTAVVNVGTAHRSWLRRNDRVFLDPRSFGNPRRGGGWGGCVIARLDGYDETDDPPSAREFTSYFGAQDYYINMWPPIRHDRFQKDANQGPNVNCGTPIIPLTKSRSEIQRGLNEMAYWWWTGGTVGNLGLSWGWRTISPRWRGLWGGPTPANRPLAYDDPLSNKFVVMLTDGNNKLVSKYYSAYPNLQGLGVSDKSYAAPVLNARMSRTCVEMKNAGIRIFTITFGNDIPTATQSLYRGCASEASMYYHAPTNEGLRKAFENIAGQLANLRVAQ